MLRGEFWCECGIGQKVMGVSESHWETPTSGFEYPYSISLGNLESSYKISCFWKMNIQIDQMDTWMDGPSEERLHILKYKVCKKTVINTQALR